MDERGAAEVCEIAVNLDDVSGEVVGHALDALLEAGALDAWTTPITMKKQRPGVCLSLLCRPEQRDRLARKVIELTGSFGVRYRRWDRLVLARRFDKVQTALGPVRLKFGLLDGRVISAKPEYDDAAALAEANGVPVRYVLDEARALAQALLMGEAEA